MPRTFPHCTPSQSRSLFVTQLVASVLSSLLLASPIFPATPSSPRYRQQETNRRESLTPQRRSIAPESSARLVPARRAAPVSPPPAFAPAITATKTDSVPNASSVNPGATITYTVTVTNTGPDPATSVVFNDSVDSNTTLVPGSVQTQPIADPDSYSASGNIPISLAPAGGVLANDRDPDTGNNTSLTVTQVQGAAVNVGSATNATATGREGVKGSVTMQSNGSFIYEPPPGFEGADSFTYQVTDGGGATDTTTVTINITGMAWFVQNNVGGSNRGTFSSPFTSIAAFNTANAGTGVAPDPKNGDFISLRTGAGTYSEADGVNLRAQQKLIGEGVAFNTAFTASANSNSAYTTFAGAAGTAPGIVTSAGNGVDLAADNTVRGLNVGNTTGFFKLNGGAVGSPVINTINLTGTGGALNVSTSGAFGANVTFGTMESSGSPGANLNLVGVTGTLGITSGGAGLSGSAASSAAVNVSGGTVSFTYPGNVSKANAGSLVSIAGGHNTGIITFQTGTLSASAGDGLQFSNADGTYNFNGTTTLNGGDAGVDITNGSSGTFIFSAATTIASPTGAAFNVAASPGSPLVTYNGAITQNTAGQRAINVDGTTGGSIGIATVTAGSVAGGVGNTGVNINNAAGSVSFTNLNLGTSGTRMTQQAVTITGGSGVKSLGAVGIFTTGTAEGIHATSSTGTISATGGTVNAVGAAAVSVVGTSAASRTPINLTFASVSANGGTKGIIVNNTSGTGFNITGTDGGDADALPDASTGGTIQNTSARGAEFINASGISLGGLNFSGATTVDGTAPADCGNAFQTASNKNCNAPIYFDTVTNAALRTVDVNGSAQTGIVGYDVAGLTMDTVTVRNGGNNIAENGGAAFKNLGGATSIVNSSFRDNTRAQFDITNNAGTTAGNINFLNNEFTGNRPVNLSAQGLLILNGGNMGTVSIGDGTAANDNSFHDTFSNGFQYAGGPGGSSATININGNSFTNTNSGVVLQVAGVGAVSTLDYSIENNTLVAGALSGSGAIITSATQGHLLTGSIRGNTIGTSGVANSGAVCNSCNGITVDHDGFGRHDVSIVGNVVQRVKSVGIYYQVADASANVSITGNLVREPEGNPSSGIFVQSGTLAADNGCVAVTLGGTVNSGFPSTAPNSMNSVQGSWDPGGFQSEIFVWRRFSTVMNLPGLSGAADAWIAARNSIPDATGPDVTATSAPFGSAASCSPPMASPVTENETNIIRGFEHSLNFSNPLPSIAPARIAPAGRQLDLRIAKRDGGTTFRYAATDTGAPLAPSRDDTQARNIAAPVRQRPQGRRDKPPAPSGAGGSVSVNIGTLAPNDSVTIIFQVTVDDPFTGMQPQVSNQGTISGSNFSNVLTDDPDTGTPGDLTITLVNAPPDISVRDAKEAEPSSGSSDMVFTVVLSAPAASNVSVDFTTADEVPSGLGKAVAGTDYTATSGTVTFMPGERLRTISVPVLSDAAASEPDETFLLNLSTPVGGNILDGQATGTITAASPPGTFLITELRSFGPGAGNDPADEFIELFNNSDSPLTVAASDASAGWGIFTTTNTDCDSAPLLLGTIPNGTVIPASGHFLLIGSTYSLANYGGSGAASGNLTISGGVPTNGNLAVFSTSDISNLSTVTRLDAVGFGANTQSTCGLLREGATAPALSMNQTLLGQHSYVRDQCGKGGSATTFGLCPTGGAYQDTNSSAVDFFFVDANGTNAGAGQRLGAPGPENITSPIRRDAFLTVSLLDAAAAAPSPPNRVRDFTSDPVNNSTQGTLSIRRRVTNTTGANVTRLRFRIVDVSTFGPQPAGFADLRARTSSPVVVSGVNDAATCAATETPTLPPCTVNVQGTTLEMLPTQPNGGGFNSTLSAGAITLGTPLAPGASINVQFLLGIQQTGSFKFYISLEALP